MQLKKVTLGEILLELDELPSSWMDETARELVDSIDETLESLGTKTPTQEDLTREFLRQPRSALSRPHLKFEKRDLTLRPPPMLPLTPLRNTGHNRTAGGWLWQNG